MFEKLKLNFETKAALFELSSEYLELQHSTLDVHAIEKVIRQAVNSAALYLMTGNWDPKQCFLVSQFERWAMKGLEDAHIKKFIFDITNLLLNNPNSENALLSLFFVGLNERIECADKAPLIENINTLLWVDALRALPRPLSVAGRDFLFKYDTTTAFTKAQEKLVTGAMVITESNLFRYLHSNKAFEFSKKLNEETGAYAYDFEGSLNKGVILLKEYPAAKVNTDLHNMVTVIHSLIIDVMQLMKSAKSSQPARLVAWWYACEWLCLLTAALKIAALTEPKYQSVLDTIMADPIMVEIYERSLMGNFPVRALEEAIHKLEIAELYFQRDLPVKFQLGIYNITKQGASPPF